MHFTSALLVAVFASVVNAHFQLQYPLPRGPFVEDLEPSFCDGYTQAVPNRTVFPISNGVINLNSEHPTWTVGVIISTAQDPTSFSDFNSSSGYQEVVPYFQTNGEGMFCFPINVGTSGVSGIQDGANVTIQVVYDGGDDILYQCADLTLSANATVPGNATSGCTNITASTTVSPPTATGTGTGTATATATATASSGAGKNMTTTFGIAVLFVLAGLVSFF